MILKKTLKKTSTVDLFNVFHKSTADVVFELFLGSRFNTLQDIFPIIWVIKLASIFLAMRLAISTIGIGANIMFSIVIGAIRILWTIKPPMKSDRSVIRQFLNAKGPETGKVLPNKSTAPCTDTCKLSLPITEAVILGNMRLHPVSAEYFTRTAPMGGTILGSYKIPGDLSIPLLNKLYILTNLLIQYTIVFCTSHSYHRNSELWETSDEFNYKHWLTPNSAELKSQIMVFSQGPKGCPERAPGWVEIFLVTALLIQRYDVKLTKGQENLGDRHIIYFLCKPATYSMKAELTHRAQVKNS